MNRIFRWLLVIVLTLATVEFVRRVGGDSAAAWFLGMVAVFIGVRVGGDWGSRQSAETEKYREALLSGQKLAGIDDPLDPNPDAVVALIRTVVSREWPASEADNEAYLTQLDLVRGDQFEPEHPTVRSGILVAPALGAAEGTWASLNGQLLSLNLFFYTGLRAGRSAAEIGYDALHDKLSEIYGPPLDEDRKKDGESSSFWKAGATLIEVYCYVRHGKSLQLGLGHAGRNAKYETLISPETEHS